MLQLWTAIWRLWRRVFTVLLRIEALSGEAARGVQLSGAGAPDFALLKGLRPGTQALNRKRVDEFLTFLVRKRYCPRYAAEFDNVLCEFIDEEHPPVSKFVLLLEENCPEGMAVLRRMAATTPRGPRLSPITTTTELGRLLRKACLALSLPIFTAHSPRAGWATTQRLRGRPCFELMEDGRWESPSSLRRYLDAVTAIAGDQTTTLISPTAVWLRGDFYHRYCGGHDPMAHNKFLPATAHPKSELIVSGSFEWRIIVEVAKSFNNGMPTDIVPIRSRNFTTASMTACLPTPTMQCVFALGSENKMLL